MRQRRWTGLDICDPAAVFRSIGRAWFAWGVWLAERIGARGVWVAGNTRVAGSFG